MDERELESLLQQNWNVKGVYVQSIFDLLPLTSTEVMYHVIDEVARRSTSSVGEQVLPERIVATIQHQYESMVGLLQNVEEYYDKLKIYNGEKLCYSDKLDKLNKQYELFKINFNYVTYAESQIKISSDTTV